TRDRSDTFCTRSNVTGASGWIGDRSRACRGLASRPCCSVCRCRGYVSYTASIFAQRTRRPRSRMREIRTSGSVGAPGEQSPAATRPRRELRGIFVLNAWVNHWDARDRNTLASWIGAEGGGYVRHYLVDFGECLGLVEGNARRVR